MCDGSPPKCNPLEGGLRALRHPLGDPRDGGDLVADLHQLRAAGDGVVTRVLLVKVPVVRQTDEKPHVSRHTGRRAPGQQALTIEDTYVRRARGEESVDQDPGQGELLPHGEAVAVDGLLHLREPLGEVLREERRGGLVALRGAGRGGGGLGVWRRREGRGTVSRGECKEGRRALAFSFWSVGLRGGEAGCSHAVSWEQDEGWAQCRRDELALREVGSARDAQASLMSRMCSQIMSMRAASMSLSPKKPKRLARKRSIALDWPSLVVAPFSVTSRVGTLPIVTSKAPDAFMASAEEEVHHTVTKGSPDD